MKFQYAGRARGGKTRRGVVEATTRAEAVRDLKRRGVTVVSIAAETGAREFSLFGVSAIEKVMLTKHLSLLLRSGVPLSDGLDILVEQAAGRLKSVLRTVRADVEAGERLGDAFERHPRVFSSFYINMVRAGEASGRLVENLERLSVRFAKDYELRQKAQSALLYPALVLVLTGGLGMMVSLFVLPRLITLFSSFDQELPWTTRALLWASQFLADNGVAFLVAVIALVAAFVWAVRQKFAAPLVHRAYLHLPFVRSISRDVNLSRFFMALGSLLQSGVPIDQAVRISSDLLGNAAYRRALAAAAARIDTGEPLSAILADHPLFPAFATRMIAVGEQTGTLEDVLAYLAEFYENELDLTLKNLSVIIEPALIIFIGVLVAAVALAIISPIYGFIGAVE